MTFKGKVVLITGAGSGIGAATAEVFAERGAKVVLVARRLDKLQEVETKCKSLNKDAETLIIQADVSVDSEKIINATIKKFGQLDVLVNNAGVFSVKSFMNSDVADLDHMLNVNVRAVHVLTKLAVPYLLKTQGNIVNVSSIGGTNAFPTAFDYCISKAAMDQFTKCLALELAPQQVRVNSVNPGTIETGIFAASGFKNVEAYLKRAREEHPLGRNGTPIDVAKCIAFLASDEASFVTGVLFPVDGGRKLQPFKQSD